MGKHKKPSSNQGPTPSEDVQIDQNPNPGANWGIMHVLKYHHWHYVKKKLPHRSKHGGGNKHETENPGDDTQASQVEDLPPKPPQSADQTASSSKVKGKKRNPGPVLKDSVKYILRAMKEERSRGKEEKAKKKGKHRRSKTCPEQARSNEMDSSDQADPEHEPSAESPSAQVDEETRDKVPNHESELKSEDNSEHETVLEDKGKQLLDKEEVTERDHDEQNQVRLTAKLLTEGVFEGQAKEIMDAMDIISMNKEFLSRVLQDPGSPLAQHFQKQQAASAKMALKRSESFPLPVHDTTRPLGPSRLKSMHTHDKHVTISPSFESKNLPKGIIDQSIPKKVGENPQVIKRFKDIRQKIKHVVKESNKQEERRITMDAVMDKIPKDKDVSNDLLKKETTRGLMYGKRDNLSVPFSRNKTMQHFDRSPSLKESMDRYLQLYESSFQKPPEKQVSRKEGALTMTKYNAKRSLARIFSSPELRCHLQYTHQDSSHLLPQDTEVNAAEKIAVTDLQQESDLEDNLSLSEVSAECRRSTSRIEEEPDQPAKDGDEHNQSNMPLSQEANLDAKVSSMHLDAVEEDDYSATMQAELEKAELLSKDLLLQISDLPQALIVDEKDEASFNYVKDVLHQAGFSGNESSSLERPWHSNDQPLDPSMVDQLQGCMLHDPNCPGNETNGGYCSHLMMFDLINEVLLEIYEGTYSYSTLMLSSRIRLKPVVEEVWMHISWYLGFRTGKKVQDLGYVVSRDLRKKDGWMNLNFDVECAGLELEELIFDGLLKELIMDLACQPCIVLH